MGSSRSSAARSTSPTIAVRVTINLPDSGVSDVGYAVTVGADRIARGQPIYGDGEFP